MYYCTITFSFYRYQCIFSNTSNSISKLNTIRTRRSFNKTTWSSLGIVWSLALLISVHEAVITRLPLEYSEYKDGNASLTKYIKEELKFLANHSLWERNRTVIVALHFPEKCSGFMHPKACTSFASPLHFQIAEIAHFLLLYGIPASIMIFCYGFILRKLLNRKIVIGSVHSAISRTARRIEASKRRHILIISIIVSVHVILWGAYYVYKLVIHVSFAEKDIDFDRARWLVSLKYFTYMTLIANPSLYMISSGIGRPASCKPFKASKVKRKETVNTVSTVSQKR